MDILHCDLDAFYASVEQRDNPSLKGKPINRNMDIFAVASNLIEKIDLRNKKIRLIGIKSSNLVRWEVEQLSLFELSSHNLDQIVDELKTRFPEVKIIPARLLKSDNIK